MKTIFALHGFLGLPSDWEILQAQMGSKYYFICPNLYDQLTNNMHQWAKCFNEWVKHTAVSPPILLSYSLGGRLALNALAQNPSIWEGAIFISTHPGLKTNMEKLNRLKADQEWSKRFENDSWDQLLDLWESQEVFKNTTSVPRNENLFSRKALAEMLKIWSLGNQIDFQSELKNINTPILWLTGEKDEKFTNIAKQLDFRNPYSKHIIVPDAGHRVQWDRPQLCNQLIDTFIKTFEEENL